MKTRLFWLALASGALAACGNSGQSPAQVDQYRDLPADYVMLDVKHFLTEDGIRRGVLNADTAFVYQDSSKVDLRKVHLLMYKPDGTTAGDLVSRSGEMNQRSNVMIARGNVVLVAPGTNDRIETQELHYDPNAHRVWSTVQTTRIQNGNRVVADGFTADDQMRNVEMTRPRGRVEGLKVTF